MSQARTVLRIGISLATLIAIAQPAAAQTLSGGAGHAVLVKDDGTLWATGANDLGQLADGTTEPLVFAPAAVTSDAQTLLGGADDTLIVKGATARCGGEPRASWATERQAGAVRFPWSPPSPRCRASRLAGQLLHVQCFAGRGAA